jgi:hypothetical protein
MGVGNSSPNERAVTNIATDLLKKGAARVSMPGLIPETWAAGLAHCFHDLGPDHVVGGASSAAH